MIIKKFTAKTENEAREAAKKDLGDKAVIMNVKEVRKRGFLGLFRTTVFEVTAALESESEKNLSVFPPAKETSGPLVPASVWNKPVLTESKESILSNHDDTGKAIVEKLDGLQQLLQQQLMKADEEKEKTIADNKENEVSSEIMTFMKLLYNTFEKVKT